MSVSVSKADGVTVFTLTSDPQSPWPPLCQLLKSLCYSPVCCSVSHQLRRIQGRSQSVLGALQIMVGLLNIGFGVLLSCTQSSFVLRFIGYPYWLGALFILFGIMCIVSEKYPSPCLVVISVILNLAGGAFAITGIVLYSIEVSDIYLWWNCRNGNRNYGYYDYYQRPTTSGPSAEDWLMIEKCEEGKAMVIMLLRGIIGVLIVLSVLELCVVISAAVLGIKSLRRRGKEQSQSAHDPELCKPLLEEDAIEPTA